MNAHLNAFPHATHLIMRDFKHHNIAAAAGMQLLLSCYCHYIFAGLDLDINKL